MSEEGNLPTFEFEKLLNDDQELYTWLVTLATQTGLAKVENAPKEPGQVIKLGERVGYLAQTSSGLVSTTTQGLVCLLGNAPADPLFSKTVLGGGGGGGSFLSR
jgi:hypothetical protein